VVERGSLLGQQRGVRPQRARRTFVVKLMRSVTAAAAASAISDS
jgi:hypothetical protein